MWLDIKRSMGDGILTFKDWDDDHWKVRVRDGYDGEKRYDLKAPSVTYTFGEHDFLQLAHNINVIAEHIHDKEFYYIHDGNIFKRNGGQLLGVIEDCEELNMLYKQNGKLQQQTIEKQKHIVNLEGKIHRMRERIKKLEELYHYRCADLKRENDELKRQIADFEFSCTENRIEFDKDLLHIKDIHTEIDLKNGKMYISVFIPQVNEYFRFNYMVTGRRLSREVIINSKELIG